MTSEELDMLSQIQAEIRWLYNLSAKHVKDEFNVFNARIKGVMHPCAPWSETSCTGIEALVSSRYGSQEVPRSGRRAHR